MATRVSRGGSRSYVNPQVILRARWSAPDGGRDEILQINFAPPDAFHPATYTLVGDATGAGQFSIWFYTTNETPDSLQWYVTHDQYTGAITITGASAADSTVSGIFSFAAEERITHVVRYLRGEFRVRYSSIEP
ncbi:MAG TPA: hypothetical protein VFT84_06090 [Gemmatimonadales bacterium]|nr:hypothetical protein [Gemmatimonadales bacterium]